VFQEQHRISLTAYGEARGYSAMARTVGYTTAIVTDMLLKGGFIKQILGSQNILKYLSYTYLLQY
jgi:hypothetical protein